MKKQLALAGAFLVLNWLCVARAGTYFTIPFVVVSPPTLDFGAVRRAESATNSLVVENVGAGILEGEATVPPPFKILSGGKYRLARNTSQVVTIVYTSNGAPTNAQVVRFSGKDHEASATVTGGLSTKPRPKPVKRK